MVLMGSGSEGNSSADGQSSGAPGSCPARKKKIPTAAFSCSVQAL